MTILRAERIVKRFPGVTALSGVSFELRPGEIHALCGENGAGKSTLIKLLSGIHPYGSYEGTLEVGGKEARFSSVADAEGAGIAVIYQELALVPEMTAAENLFLGREPVRGGLIDWQRMRKESLRLLAGFGLDIDPNAPTSKLGVGQRQLLEILKALRKEPKILILDEPTAALSDTEVGILLAKLRELRGRGIACVYISHKLEEVFAVCDRITVLRDGAAVTTLEAAKTSSAEVIRHMVGREIKDLFPRKSCAPGETLLGVAGLCVADASGSPYLEDISFEVRAGEVLGIGGLMGAGRSELLMHLFGAWGKRMGGEVKLAGRALSPGNPRESISKGLVLVSEDRRRYGLVLDKSVGFNMSLSSLKKFLRKGLIDRHAEAVANQGFSNSLRVKAPSLEAVVGGLSGGNQQKVVIGKALMTEPKVVLLDEPTRGIDVGAKQEVYGIVNELTASGKAVILVSSELPELMGMSDRILMLHEGRVGGRFPSGASAEELLAAALGKS
ncbi:MAG: sugar ABC transporter ATP-binding protein [Elusimicrobia bacterium]|nr:sugar ABC transporter ATP-binding protein [Elusimicrobiota bacterium]